MVQEFREFGFEGPGQVNKVANYRVSAINPNLHGQESDKILSMKEETSLLKKLEEEMEKVHEEALQKNVHFATSLEIDLLCLYPHLGLRGTGHRGPR